MQESLPRYLNRKKKWTAWEWFIRLELLAKKTCADLLSVWRATIYTIKTYCWENIKAVTFMKVLREKLKFFFNIKIWGEKYILMIKIIEIQVGHFHNGFCNILYWRDVKSFREIILQSRASDWKSNFQTEHKCLWRAKFFRFLL